MPPRCLGSSVPSNRLFSDVMLILEGLKKKKTELWSWKRKSIYKLSPRIEVNVGLFGTWITCLYFDDFVLKPSGSWKLQNILKAISHHCHISTFLQCSVTTVTLSNMVHLRDLRHTKPLERTESMLNIFFESRQAFLRLLRLQFWVANHNIITSITIPNI